MIRYYKQKCHNKEINQVHDRNAAFTSIQWHLYIYNRINLEIINQFSSCRLRKSTKTCCVVPRLLTSHVDISLYINAPAQTPYTKSILPKYFDCWAPLERNVTSECYDGDWKSIIWGASVFMWCVVIATRCTINGRSSCVDLKNFITFKCKTTVWNEMTNLNWK